MAMEPLAVPSDGSNLMQHIATTYRYLDHAILQYPQTGRTSCNSAAAAVSAPSLCLQYPQTGRTSCNRWKAGEAPLEENPCSTLRRVEPHATEEKRRWMSTALSLQYPQTGRTSCNWAGLRLRSWSMKLAVPSDGSNLMQRQNARQAGGRRGLAVP